jgi:hypothetical protein
MKQLQLKDPGGCQASILRLIHPAEASTSFVYTFYLLIFARASIDVLSLAHIFRHRLELAASLQLRSAGSQLAPSWLVQAHPSQFPGLLLLIPHLVIFMKESSDSDSISYVPLMRRAACHRHLSAWSVTTL